MTELTMIDSLRAICLSDTTTWSAEEVSEGSGWWAIYSGDKKIAELEWDDGGKNARLICLMKQFLHDLLAMTESHTTAK